ncbi:MAG TPA: YceI family protein [Thermomicrobiales bacterium]|jgi:polyisoprenoid-binding protein YceI|nr:YceI family protein [Thermomicrobiales bacterium]
MRRWRALALIALIPVLVVAGFGVYLLSLAGELPGQVAPTPISAGVTPFAVASAGQSAAVPAPATPVGTPAADPGAAAPAASPIAGGRVYAIVGAQSQVRYVVHEKLAGVPVDSDAVGATRAIDGQIDLDAAGRPLPGSTVRVDLRTLTSDKVRRDNDVKRLYLETDKYPIATFVVRRFDGLSAPLRDGESATGRVVGDLTAHGVTKSVVWNVSGVLTGDTLSGHATTTFTFETFDMPVPDIAGMVSARDPVTLQFDFTAKRVG